VNVPIAPPCWEAGVWLITISASDGNSSDSPAPMTSPPATATQSAGAIATSSSPTASTSPDQNATRRGPNRSGQLPSSSRTATYVIP
jgi:hypothetical protein